MLYRGSYLYSFYLLFPLFFLAFFFFNDTATTEIYTLSLHDALPTFRSSSGSTGRTRRRVAPCSRKRRRRTCTSRRQCFPPPSGSSSWQGRDERMGRAG